MCRFLLYIGAEVLVSDLITEPENSLINQSFHSIEREEPLNGDGFGLAWYVHAISQHPGIFRSISPAWSNRNLRHLARITRSHCVLAHVRAASEGLGVAETNCHPFSYGPFSFMHNGGLANFATLRRGLLGQLSETSYNLIEGTTDSEFLFAYFLDRWNDLEKVTDASERLAQAMIRTIEELVAFCKAHHATELSYLNMAVCDGNHAVISRYTTDELRFAESLHIHTGKVYHVENGVCRLTKPKDGSGAVIVSSERLSDDFGWETIPANHLVVVRNDRSVQIRPCKSA